MVDEEDELEDGEDVPCDESLKDEKKIVSPSETSNEKHRPVENKAVGKLIVEDILATRILTDEDFEAIRKRQAEKQVSSITLLTC